jgi:hypothetical protein
MIASVVASIFLLFVLLNYRNRYIQVRDRVIVYDAVVIDFSVEDILPLGFFTVNRQKRCDITLYIPETGEELQISSILLGARKLKVGKHTKIHYFPDEIYDPTIFIRQKLLPFEIIGRTPLSLIIWILLILALTAGGVILFFRTFG